MKKIKLLTPFLSVLTLTTVAPAITACAKKEDKKDTTVKVDLTKVDEKLNPTHVAQSFALNQDSWIMFNALDGYKMDESTVKVTVGDTALVKGTGFTIDTSTYGISHPKISIPAAYMKATTVTIEAKSAEIVTLDFDDEKTRTFWYAGDTFKAEHVGVVLKTGETSTEIKYGSGQNNYSVYYVPSSGPEQKIDNFDTTGYTTAAGTIATYKFKFVYNNDTSITANYYLKTNETISMFLTKYDTYLTNYAQTIASEEKFDYLKLEDATFNGEDVSGNHDITYDTANPYPATIKLGSKTVTMAGITHADLETYLNKFLDWKKYEIFFEEGSEHLKFTINDADNSKHFIEVKFNKNSYITNWTNTFADPEMTYYSVKMLGIGYKQN